MKKFKIVCNTCGNEDGTVEGFSAQGTGEAILTCGNPSCDEKESTLDDVGRTDEIYLKLDGTFDAPEDVAKVVSTRVRNLCQEHLNNMPQKKAAEVDTMCLNIIANVASENGWANVSLNYQVRQYEILLVEEKDATADALIDYLGFDTPEEIESETYMRVHAFKDVSDDVIKKEIEVY